MHLIFIYGCYGEKMKQVIFKNYFVEISIKMHLKNIYVCYGEKFQTKNSKPKIECCKLSGPEFYSNPH